MAQILIRNIEDSLKNSLQKLAKYNGRSVEAEVREILRDAVKQEAPALGLGTEIAEMFRGVGLEEPIPEIRGMKMRIPKF